MWCGKSNVNWRAVEAERAQRRIAETPRREAEQAADREMWQLARGDFDSLSKAEQVQLSSWSESSSEFGASTEDRGSSGSFEVLVREVDARTKRTVEAFQTQAAAIVPTPVEIATREVKVTVEGERRGLLRPRARPREVTRIVGDKTPGHRIFSWFDNAAVTPEGPLDPRSQDLYVLADGTMRLHGGYQYSQVQRCGRPGQPPRSVLATLAYTAGIGQLPGFLSPDRSYTRYGPLIPGLPRDIAALQKTAVWLEARLRERVARSPI
jgi:hypothetical protein